MPCKVTVFSPHNQSMSAVILFSSFLQKRKQNLKEPEPLATQSADGEGRICTQHPSFGFQHIRASVGKMWFKAMKVLEQRRSQHGRGREAGGGSTRAIP